ncbi:FadR/GntR family transcriptional regulator [Trueperella pyogenes]|uniref:FadR/GntR family transcriptional regulator n=2 Tax=Trueperella pyogenes TaxID=1661 RepID=UPI00345DF7AE
MLSLVNALKCNKGIEMVQRKKPRNHTRPTDNWVVGAIKELILERNLQSGDMLPSEAELTEILGVARSSIREAIKVLSTLDIVEVRHGTGTYVSNMSLQPMVQSIIFRGALTPSGGLVALGDMIEIRALLDNGYAGSVVKKLAGKGHPELHALVDRMERLAHEGKPFLDVDREFHKAFAKRANNLLLLQLVDAFWDVQDVVYQKLAPASQESLINTARIHRLILEAAETGNVRLYKKLLVEHYRPLREKLPHPNYYPDEN